MDQVDVLITSRIDMNRCFPYNFTLQYSSRNYTGANSFGAPEAKAIKGYLEKINSSSTEMIVLDFHGWMNFTQGNAEVGRYFGNQFGFGHNNGYSSGFFSSWASTLKNTKAVLIEYPTSTHSYSDVITGNYIGKTFNGIINVLKNNSGSSSEWIQKGDSWYYYENGLMVTGWKSINGSWYYLQSNGVMATGWNSINGSWYYLESSGVMATGWKQLEGKRYYLNINGSMKIGWLTLDGNGYYFNSSGHMAIGETIIANEAYYFDKLGMLLLTPSNYEKLTNEALNIMAPFKIERDEFKLNKEFYIHAGPVYLKYEFGIQAQIGSGETTITVSNGKIENIEFMQSMLSITTKLSAIDMISKSIGDISSIAEGILSYVALSITDGTIKFGVNLIENTIEIEVAKEIQEPEFENKGIKLYINLTVGFDDEKPHEILKSLAVSAEPVLFMTMVIILGVVAMKSGAVVAAGGITVGLLVLILTKVIAVFKEDQSNPI
ncbi:hypothetical protein [Clostridium algidicarnis]|uniref:Putative cell wall binding repeat protein n=2 Tax=Clostridium algidicarnis TaxID=37659 RepID=A0A2S6FUV5_9CLOT|nr:putative cell wall binding repeat protein [Clostridium algidicarnis DSM 15099]